MPGQTQRNASAKKRDIWLLVTILLLISAAFIADLRLPLGVAGGVPFVVPVALTLWFFRPVYTWTVAGISSLLIVLNIFLKPSSGVPLYFVVINRSYAFLAIGIVVGIGQLQRRLVRQSERLSVLSVMEERERLSRELHDDLSQLLGDIGARASAVSELLAQSRTEEAQQEVARLRDSASHAYLDVRQYITGLRVHPWGDRRFLKTLEDFAKYFAQQAGLRLNLELPENSASFKLAPNAEIQAIRIVQEALTNTARHANAKNMWVKVSLDGTFLQITVRDDGLGFDASTIDLRSHLGLQMMQERAELVGGKLTVTSAPGHGTSVTAMLPYQDRRE